MDTTAGENQNKIEHLPKSLVEQHKEKLSKRDTKERREVERQFDEKSEEELKEERLKMAKENLEAMDREADRLLSLDERKRPYNSMKADFSRMPTEEEMEVYKLKRRRENDPMADFLTK